MAAGPVAAPWRVGHAMACLQLGDPLAAEQSVDAALALDATNLWAQILKGDLRLAASDERAALAFYQRALDSAPNRDTLPVPLADALSRIQRTRGRLLGDVERRLRDSLGAEITASGRFQEAVDILFGHRKLYVQSPKYFHLPGLASIAFFPREPFTWLTKLESRFANIRNEAAELLGDSEAFRPYIESSRNRPQKDQDGLTDNADWGACYLWRNGVPNDPILKRCPATAAAISDIPLADIPNRSPTVLFSRLRPGAHIPPHCGLINTRLIGHLPLIVPACCEFRVGNETRVWREGQSWLFDDTIEHEAWNRSAHERVIMIFEIWRPEISESERALLRRLFSTLDQIGAPTQAWEI